MKKSLSLLAFLGLLGFVALPSYAQEDVVLDEEPIVAEDVEAGDDFIIVDETDYNPEISDEEMTIDLGEIESFNDIFEDEEVKNALDEAGLTNEEAAGILGVFAGVFASLGLAAWIISIVWAIITIVAMWKIFEKAGEAGWKSIIPIYNVYIMYKIVGMKNWFWYTLIVAFVGGFIAGLLGDQSSIGGYISIATGLFSGIVSIVAAYKLPRKFGWGVFTSILYVLFTGICVLILGFGNFKYQGKSTTVVEA